MKLRLMQLMSRGLLALALVAFAFQAFTFITGRLVHLERIEVKGGDIVTENLAEKVLEHLHHENLLQLDLLYWRAQLESLPGVARASLYRSPHKRLLRVNLELHRPLARWDGGGKINVFGQRYDSDSTDATLPIFKGEETRTMEISEFYDDAQRTLAEVGDIAQLELTPRGSWVLFLKSGMLLRLGSHKPRARLSRYVRYYDVIKQQFPHAYVVDLRYERGFSLVEDNQPITEG